MVMNDQAVLSSQWRKLARRTARKVNLGWWLQALNPWLIASSVILFTVVLWWRNQPSGVSASPYWPALLPLLLILSLAAYLQIRHRFIHLPQALVRLESELHLHNALSVAHLGQGRWPEIPPHVQDGWQWRWRQLCTPWLISLALLLLAFHLPISPALIASRPQAEPQSWQQMEEWLSQLEDEKLITPEEKAEQAAKIAELREQSPEQWFSHDSLHASDTLKEQLQRDMARLSQNLSRIERSLNGLQNYASQLSPATRDQLLQDMSEAIKDLQTNGLELHPDLLKELKSLDPQNLSGLSKEQLNQLRETLKQGAQQSGSMGSNPGFLGDGEGADDELAEMLGRLKQGQGNSPGEGEGEGDQPGEGGISRGPGSAPLTLSDEENDFGTQNTEAVSNPDLSRVQLSTQLGLKDGKHDVDKTFLGPTSAGNTTNTGQGGEQVWRDTLTPEEKAVLKRVFK